VLLPVAAAVPEDMDQVPRGAEMEVDPAIVSLWEVGKGMGDLVSGELFLRRFGVVHRRVEVFRSSEDSCAVWVIIGPALVYLVYVVKSLVFDMEFMNYDVAIQ